MSNGTINRAYTLQFPIAIHFRQTCLCCRRLFHRHSLVRSSGGSCRMDEISQRPKYHLSALADSAGFQSFSSSTTCHNIGCLLEDQGMVQLQTAQIVKIRETRRKSLTGRTFKCRQEPQTQEEQWLTIATQ